MSKILRIIKKLSEGITHPYRYDPVRKCLLYRNEGCSHVDGYLCDFHTCKMRKDYIDKYCMDLTSPQGRGEGTMKFISIIILFLVNLLFYRMPEEF